MGTTSPNSYLLASSLSDEATESTTLENEKSQQNQSFNGYLLTAVLAGCLIYPIINTSTNVTPDYSISSHYGEIGQLNEINFEESINEIVESYQRYPTNWDGYDGIPPSVDTVKDTLLFLMKLPFGVTDPRPGLSGDGEISLFWEYGNIFVDVGFIGNGKYTFYARDSQSVEYFRDDIDLNNALPEALLNIIYIK